VIITGCVNAQTSAADPMAARHERVPDLVAEDRSE
jgi:hypothetical protein